MTVKIEQNIQLLGMLKIFLKVQETHQNIYYVINYYWNGLDVLFRLTI